MVARHEPISPRRHGRKIMAKIKAAKLSRKAVTPAGGKTANMLFANEALLVIEISEKKTSNNEL